MEEQNIGDNIPKNQEQNKPSFPKEKEQEEPSAPKTPLALKAVLKNPSSQARLQKLKLMAATMEIILIMTLIVLDLFRVGKNLVHMVQMLSQLTTWSIVQQHTDQLMISTILIR